MDKFQFCGEVVKAISELMMEETIQGPEINSIHTVYPDIVTKTELGFVGEGGMVGVAGQGCSPTPQGWNIATRKLTWEPKVWEILLAECYTALENAATIYSLRTGVDIPDFTDTDYMNLVMEVLKKSIMDFWYRLFWFNDTAAKNVADGGVITAGVDVKFFTIIDGLWKQIIAQATANTKQRAATITENAAATYDAQALNPANVKGYLSKVVFGAPLQLRNMNDRFILVTQSVYDAYTQALQDACCLESARVALLNGVDALSYNGIPVIAMPIWDKMIAAYEDTGTKLNNPHRILFTSKSVLGVGVDAIDSFDKFRIWYEKKDRQVYIEAMGRADAKLTNPEYFSLGI
nr:MAG TPA: major capsid protein [Caudoviricetes sp.]